MAIAPALVKELREKTGCGMMDCKKALEEANGSIEQAIEILRKKGLAELAKKVGRAAKEGLVDAYIHPGGRIGVLLEVNCETDFVARNEDFKNFVHDVAMQIAAASPLYVSREQVPEEVVKNEKEIYRAQAVQEGKPEQFLDKIVSGRLEKFYQAVCLLEQPFIKNQDITVQDYLGSVVAKIGENISIRRFTRYQLGEEL
jgi:elongation factor Ts